MHIAFLVYQFFFPNVLITENFGSFRFEFLPVIKKQKILYLKLELKVSKSFLDLFVFQKLKKNSFRTSVIIVVFPPYFHLVTLIKVQLQVIFVELRLIFNAVFLITPPRKSFTRTPKIAKQ